MSVPPQEQPRAAPSAHCAPPSAGAVGAPIRTAEAPPRLATASLVVPLALAAVGLCLFSPFTADDAFLVERYARNLVAGHGLVFNVGERVSALTSPAHALVLAALALTGLDALAVYKGLGAVLLLALLASLAQRSFHAPHARAAFLLLTAASPFVVMWTVGGLETPLLALPITGLAAASLRKPTRATSELAVLLGALASLIRYDSVLFSAPVVAFLVWPQLRRRSFSWLWVVPPCLPVAWLAFAYRYYGDVLPTSFYVKGPALDVRELLKGGLYEAHALLLSGLPILLGLASERRAAVRRHFVEHPSAVGLWLGLGATFAYGVSASAKHMMFGYRLFVPYLPAVVLLALRVIPFESLRRRGLALGLVACLQAGLLLVVWRVSVNPNLPGAFGKGYEYSHVSLHAYAHEFLGALERNADDVRRHWRSTHPRAERPPRIATFAAGKLPAAIEDAYVYEALVSFRKGCAGAKWRDHADYVHILQPRHGTAAAQLGWLSEGGRPISRVPLRFDGQPESFEVWFNPEPRPNTISASINQPCAPD